MAIIIYPRHGIWYIAWVRISNPIPLMGSLQYAHIRFMWNRKIFLISLPQQNTNFVTSTREGYQLQNFATTSDQYAHDGGDTMKLFSTRDRVVVMCWLSAYVRTGRAMTMFYAGTPSHVSGVINRVTWHLMLCWWLSRRSESGLCLIFCDKYARVASTAYTLDIHFVTNAISSGIRIDKINRTMIHFWFSSILSARRRSIPCISPRMAIISLRTSEKWLAWCSMCGVLPFMSDPHLSSPPAGV